MGSLSIWHWLVVIGIGILLFGGKGKISSVMGDFAKGIKAFKSGMKEPEEETATNPPPAQVTPPGAATSSSGAATSPAGAATSPAGTATVGAAASPAPVGVGGGIGDRPREHV